MSLAHQQIRDELAKPVLDDITADQAKLGDAGQAELVKYMDAIRDGLYDDSLTAGDLRKGAKITRDQEYTFRIILGQNGQPGPTGLQYRDEKRLAVGREMLEHTNLKPPVISNALEFSYEATFRKKFTQQYSISPAEYRKQCAQKRTRQITGEVAVNTHEKAVRLALRGQVDAGLPELRFAEQAYLRAGTLPQALQARKKSLTIPSEPEEALLAKLCPDDRARLLSPDGSETFDKLRHDCLHRIQPFETECDDCYRVLWDGISMARGGNMRNALEAYWLATYADQYGLEVPSRGRYILDIHAVEKMVGGDQDERIKRCERAARSAEELKDNILKFQANKWQSIVLVALAEFSGARTALQRDIAIPQHLAWPQILHHRAMAALESALGNDAKALEAVDAMIQSVDPLDSHLSGLGYILRAKILRAKGYCEEAIASVRCSLPLVDNRLDPLIKGVVIPLDLAVSYCMSNQPREARQALGECQGDAPDGWAPYKTKAEACVSLEEGRLMESIELFEGALWGFKECRRMHEVALTASCLIEPYTLTANRTRALECADIALRSFRASERVNDFETLSFKN